MDTPIFSLVGNIGAGKTTLLGKIKDDLKNILKKDYVVIPEPVNKWTEKFTDDSGIESMSILELYYKNPTKYAFCFQMYALQTRFEQLREMMEIHKGKILIYERCPISDYNIFAKLLYQSGLMNSHEFYIYKRWFDMTYDIIKPNICGVIYLNVPISLCANRIIKRNRDGEGNISIEYLKSLEKVHHEWLYDDSYCKNESNPPMYEIEFDDKHYEHVNVSKLSNFINTICD